MNFVKVSFLSIILCSMDFSRLQAEDVLSLAPNEAIEMAMKQNRNLQIARLEIDRAITRLRWSGMLSNPDLKIAAADDFAGLNEGEDSLQISFSQKFPVTSRLKREKGLRRVEVLLAESELAENRRALAHEVLALCVAILNDELEAKAHERLILLNKEIVDSLQRRAQLGEASNLEVSQMRLRGRSLAREDRVHEAISARRILALKKMLNVNAGKNLQVKGTLELPEAAPLKKINLESVLEKRPDYLASIVRIDVSRADLALQKAKRWQDVSLSLLANSENSNDEPRGLERNTFLGIGISIPLPIRNRNQQGIEEAGINIDASQRASAAREFEIENELESALLARFEAWKLAREAQTQDVPLANENFEAFKKAYENGQVDLIQVQRAQEQLIELETTTLQLLRDYHLADAQVRYVSASYPDLHVSSDKTKTPIGE